MVGKWQMTRYKISSLNHKPVWNWVWVKLGTKEFSFNLSYLGVDRQDQLLNETYGALWA